MAIRKRKDSPAATAALRKKIPVTQQELAQYCGISATLLALHEKGTRSINSKATIKLDELEITFASHINALARAAAQTMPEVDTQLAAKLSRKAVALRKQVSSLTGKLEDKRNLLQQQEIWLSFVQHKIESLPVSKENNGDRLWLEVQQANVAHKVKKGKEEKLKLQLQVALAAAAADVHDSFEKRMRKGKL